MYENFRQKDFFFGALVGGLVATLTSLLFTTRKGKEIQRQIADTYGEVEESVKEAFSKDTSSPSNGKSKGEDLPPDPQEKKSNYRHKADEHHSK